MTESKTASAVKLTFPLRSKPHLAGKSRETAFARNRMANAVAVLTYASQSYLASTDGRALAMVPCDLAGDLPTPGAVIPAPIVETATKGTHTLEVSADTASARDKTGSDHVSPLLDLPNMANAVQNVIPDREAWGTTRRISLSVDLLAKLAKTLGCDGVELSYDAASEGRAPIHVRPISANIGGKTSNVADAGAFGLLMPISEDK